MKRLLIAAGGGGDAITAAMVHTALHGRDTPALVLSYAWERLVVDPVPGPRGIADFTALDRPAPDLALVTPRTAPRAPAGSLLPRLAGGLRPALGLLDPYDGTIGLTRQIEAAARWCGADQVDLVDVGGDIVARGDEPTLRSPLGDALALAACAATGLPTSVYVAGPGLDNEVPRSVLAPRLGAPAFALAPGDTDDVLSVFDWHPSEAGAMLVAAARGVRGVCGTRDAPAPVVLDDSSHLVYRLACEDALRLSPLAQALALCPGLDAAEKVSHAVCGFSEIDRERRRAALLPAPTAPRPAREPDVLLDLYLAFEHARRAEGLTYVTTRRIAEDLLLGPVEADTLFRSLATSSPDRRVAPLWRLAEI
ncbi:DUF1152 domain-containing protein [Streptomyces sp. adm13(2018)]|uniref:DUF1152 domain-containing protein n=1 Tax=Streptomyces sp. adm13(2018) TaxID=2479007 RepID=UPI0011CEA480|nr:DUF1152 domain-containing protein [Streptomyces sp. adm13(2018)]TXS01538.1 DUF1152 domain-containing protein [Streptomyces sp. adm13(2018)]